FVSAGKRLGFGSEIKRSARFASAEAYQLASKLPACLWGDNLRVESHAGGLSNTRILRPSRTAARVARDAKRRTFLCYHHAGFDAQVAHRRNHRAVDFADRSRFGRGPHLRAERGT